MNIDPEKIKELVLIYSKLNEDYQKKLMKQAYLLELEQSQLKHIKNEGLQFKTDAALQEEIDKRSYKCAKDSIDLLESMKDMDSTDKAALFMLMNQLSGRGNAVQESDIAITVNQREISMKDYIEKHLVDADYDKAREKVTGFMYDMKKRKNHSDD